MNKTRKNQSELIWITKRLTFTEVLENRILPIDAYEILVTDWILEPGNQLAKLRQQNHSDTDHGMALLALEMLFFEPHGQYLNGKSSERASKENFCTGFSQFRNFLLKQGDISKDTSQLDSKSFYKFARCGLFHSLCLSNELLVDTRRTGKGCLARNPMIGGWLVDPWLMLSALEKYLKSYVESVRRSPAKSELSVNFHRTYGRLLREPAEHFSSLINSGGLAAKKKR